MGTHTQKNVKEVKDVTFNHDGRMYFQNKSYANMKAKLLILED